MNLVVKTPLRIELEALPEEVEDLDSPSFTEAYEAALTTAGLRADEWSHVAVDRVDAKRPRIIARRP